MSLLCKTTKPISSISNGEKDNDNANVHSDEEKKKLYKETLRSYIMVEHGLYLYQYIQ